MGQYNQFGFDENAENGSDQTNQQEQTLVELSCRNALLDIRVSVTLQRSKVIINLLLCFMVCE